MKHSPCVLQTHALTYVHILFSLLPSFQKFTGTERSSYSSAFTTITLNRKIAGVNGRGWLRMHRCRIWKVRIHEQNVVTDKWNLLLPPFLCGRPHVFLDCACSLAESDRTPALWMIRRNEWISQWQLVNPLPGSHCTETQSQFTKTHIWPPELLFSNSCAICEWIWPRVIYNNHNRIHWPILAFSLLTQGKDFSFFPSSTVTISEFNMWQKSKYFFLFLPIETYIADETRDPLIFMHFIELQMAIDTLKLKCVLWVK